jgi:general stress protein 26
MLRARPYVFLCTPAVDGSVSVRQVQPFLDDDALDLWVGTSPRSRKVAEIESSGRATVALDDPAAAAAASLRCTATVVDDLDVRLARWDEATGRAFFPDGPDGDDFVLIHLVPTRIELIDFANEITPEPYGLVPAVIELVDGSWVGVTADRRG